MTPKTKKILIWASVIIILGVIAYFGWKKWKESQPTLEAMPATPQQALDGSAVSMPVANTVSTNTTPTVAPPIVVTSGPKVNAYKKGNNTTVAGPTSGTGSVTMSSGI